MITLFLNEALRMLQASSDYKALRRRMEEGRFPLNVYGPEGSFCALLVKTVFSQRGGPLCIITSTEQEAEDLVADLRLFRLHAELFPWWGVAPYKKLPFSSPVFGRRVKILNDLLRRAPSAVVIPLRAFLTPVPDPAYIRQNAISIEKGAAIDPIACSRSLQSFGYLRVPRVTVPGEFALRGEVLDIFLPGYDTALRIVFDFDQVGDIRFFDTENQASTESINAITLYPMKEVIWTDERIACLADNLKTIPEIGHDAPALLEELIETRGFEGEHIFYHLAFPRVHSLMEYFPASCRVLFLGEERINTAREALHREYEGLYAHAEAPALPPRTVLSSLEPLRARSGNSIHINVLPETGTESGNSKPLNLRPDMPRSFFGNLDFFREELTALLETGYSVFIFADTEAQAMRITHILPETATQSGRVSVIPESISAGFTFAPAKIAVITEGEIFGRRRRIPKSIKTVESRAIDSFVDLSEGDFVVHVNYGIGRYKGIQRIKASGNERDYIHLEYSGEEFIYLPIEQVNLIQRYIGHEGSAPRLDLIGSKSWENRKNRVRKSVEDIAARLIGLYSKRKKTRGFAFPADTEWQIEFEAAFPFDETPDQRTCIEEVKADMEKPVPMDRMICGDVGYGKTEIAIRAAFKAVSGGKQVAILAPTTILAEQHYETITERMKKYPVTAAMLSRFVTKAEQKNTLAGLKEGKIDLIVGTHRLLQKDVAFRDLGLIVVDEEQRFGVKDKERLKELKTSVDCLTLTATPIPRTLHMSLLKIRDMSVLKTPPARRLPIETHIMEFSPKTIAGAIRREIARGGQVYYLHNRVESLHDTRLFLQNHVPEVLISTAHGQMSAEELEDIMHRFIHGGIQVLVSTTIVENGIDIPNVNTIIIDRADMYGISQLYQLRGRVGRSDRPAYAYLFYPTDKALSEIAMKRLQIISDNTALGSGFKIALKDLEVRGAGNLLGREQSGDILSVGFDMYLRLLDEAVAGLENKETDELPEVYLELEYSGFIPDTYIGEAEEKMEVYKKIAAVGSDEELAGLDVELTDRFGPLPAEVQSLLALAEIRIICKKLWISSVRERKGRLELEFSKVAKIPINRLLALIRDSRGQLRLDPHRPYILIMDTKAVDLKGKSEFLRDRLSVLL
ncbi:MAG: transcription-repair coupling factor [Spirochaetales bacterium]|jgi:transcription-repair coupling factor (superfamily II helicase)|nr:transcription-repair coupling factor [Spirochaetales bacterium]